MTEMAVETLDQMLNRMCETLREADRDDKSDAATNWNHHCKYATDQLVDADAADREEAAARLGMKATVARLRCLCDCTDSTRRRLLAPRVRRATVRRQLSRHVIGQRTNYNSHAHAPHARRLLGFARRWATWQGWRGSQWHVDSILFGNQT